MLLQNASQAKAKGCQEGNVVLPGTAKRMGMTKTMSAVTLQAGRCIRGDSLEVDVEAICFLW
jgi:hypothetical protein